MAFSVEIKNLGKIAGAPIVVGGLTVLAGPNATGKTFFSKALYSVFDAMNANHALMQIQALTQPLEPPLWELSDVAVFEKNPALKAMNAGIRRLQVVCASVSGKGDEITAVGENFAALVENAGEIVRAYRDLRPDMEKVAKANKDEESELISFDEDSLASMDAGIKNLEELTRRNPEDVVFSGFRRALHQNLIGNFQIPTLGELKGDVKQDSSIAIEGVGDISIAGGAIAVHIRREGLTRLQAHSRVIYLESPFYWKLRGALKGAFPRFLPFRGRRGLSIPKYFTDLDAALSEEYSGEVAFPSLLKRITGEGGIGGQITQDESGRLVFNEIGKSRHFRLPLTATGAVNLGILALLIAQKIIDKGAFLFIDEPEANLHPKWQVEMMRALFELARGGVHVVIATHSPDIMERLSALVRNNPGTEEMVALNHFSPEGVKNGGKDFNEKMDDIQRELTDSFSNSYMENVS